MVIKAKTWNLIEERKLLTNLLSIKLTEVRQIRARLNQIDKELK